MPHSTSVRSSPARENGGASHVRPSRVRATGRGGAPLCGWFEQRRCRERAGQPIAHASGRPTPHCSRRTTRFIGRPRSNFVLPSPTGGVMLAARTLEHRWAPFAAECERWTDEENQENRSHTSPRDRIWLLAGVGVICCRSGSSPRQRALSDGGAAVASSFGRRRYIEGTCRRRGPRPQSVARAC